MRRQIIGSVLILAVGGCAQVSKKEEKSEAAAIAAAPKKAQAILLAGSKEKIKGSVEFVPVDGQMKIRVKVEGLKPGAHGFHIHDKGDCSSADFNSAGPHFNPENVPHGAPGVAPQHAGDLGNLIADKSGKADVEISAMNLSLGESPFKIIGKAVIIHQDKDDLKTQPTGNAGKRIACGVIEAL